MIGGLVPGRTGGEDEGWEASTYDTRRFIHGRRPSMLDTLDRVDRDSFTAKRPTTQGFIWVGWVLLAKMVVAAPTRICVPLAWRSDVKWRRRVLSCAMFNDFAAQAIAATAGDEVDS